MVPTATRCMVVTPMRGGEQYRKSSDFIANVTFVPEVQISEKIVDLNLGLYIGSTEDKIWSMQGLGAAAEMAQNKDLMKKASDGLKKLTKDWQIARLVQWLEMRGEFSQVSSVK